MVIFLTEYPPIPTESKSRSVGDIPATGSVTAYTRTRPVAVSTFPQELATTSVTVNTPTESNTWVGL